MSKKQPALTQWFPKSVNPVRKGLYQIRFEDGSGDYRKWNGRRWTFEDGASSLFDREHGGKWRGLAEKPE